MNTKTPSKRPLWAPFTGLFAFLAIIWARNVWHLWQQEKGNSLVATFPVGRGASRDSTRIWYVNTHQLLVRNEDSTRLWDISTRSAAPHAILKTLAQDSGSSAKWRCLTSYHDSQKRTSGVAVSNALTGQEFSRLESADRDWWPIPAPTLSHDGTMVIGAVQDYGKRSRSQNYVDHVTLTAWSTATGRRLWTVDEPAPTYSSGILYNFPVAFSPDDKTLVEATLSSELPAQADIRLRDARTGQLIRTLISSPDGGQSSTSSNGGWDLIAFSPDGTKIAAVGGNPLIGSVDGHEEAIFMWDVKTGDLLWKSYKPYTMPKVLAFSPDGNWLTCGCYSMSRSDSFVGGEITLWDTKTGQLLRTLTRETAADALAYSAQINAKRARELFAKRQGKRVPADKSFPIEVLAFSPDNSQIAGCDSEGVMCIWQLK